MDKKLSAGHDFALHRVGDFLRTLGSDSPSPGGGAAAALTGGLGASLIEMVSRINEKRWLKKNPSKKHSGTFHRNIVRLQKIRVCFAELMRLDTESFLELSGFPTADRQTARYQGALKRTAGFPLVMCEKAVQSLAMGVGESRRTSRWLASDLLEAGILLEASFHSGRLNVAINLGSIQDKSFVRRVKKRLDVLDRRIKILNKKISLSLTHA
ncbi:MAG: hypothetical protein AUJ71_01195 [Candidatus Omnitrophica bacterium CG1_02_49_16]|nr:MAG: hypothetical protein AUJ71_01195 [Candidatus Omnitrophica bacterium CG1_02_49_16]